MKTKIGRLNRAQLHETQRKAKEHSDPNELTKWAASRPQAIQDLIKRFDMNKVWRIKKGAPYKVTGEGSLGVIIGFSEKRMSRIVDPFPDDVVIFACTVMCYDETQMDARELAITEANDQGVQVKVSPEWLEEDEAPSIAEIMASN